jgi:hypothetical protein
MLLVQLQLDPSEASNPGLECESPIWPEMQGKPIPRNLDYTQEFGFLAFELQRARLNLFWAHLDPFLDPFNPIFDLFKPIWGLFKPIWTCLDLFEPL